VNCRKVSQLISAYMDAELQSVEHRQVRDHLLRCDECHEEYDQLLQMKRMLGSLSVKEPRADVQNRILYHIAWEEQQRTNKHPANWLSNLIATGRASLISVNPGVIGFGAVLIAAALVVRGTAPPPPTIRTGAISWEPAHSNVQQYVEGLQPSDGSHFASRPIPVGYSMNTDYVNYYSRDGLNASRSSASQFEDIGRSPFAAENLVHIRSSNPLAGAFR